MRRSLALALLTLAACSPAAPPAPPADASPVDASPVDVPIVDLGVDTPDTDVARDAGVDVPDILDAASIDRPDVVDAPDAVDVPSIDHPDVAPIDVAEDIAPDRPAMDVVDAPLADVAPCTSTVTIDGTAPDFFWVGQATDTASLSLRWSGPAWLAGSTDGNSLTVTLVGARTVGGAHHASLHLRDATGRELATVEAGLRALGTARPDAAPKVLVIGIDGVRGDAMEGATLPTLRSLLAHAAASFHVSTQRTGPTLSGPGWTSILTGVGPDKHRVVGNAAYNLRNPEWPTFLARAHDGLGLRTAVASQWADIPTGIVEPSAMDDRATGDGATVSTTMARWLRAATYDVHFVHFDDVDHAGHTTGFSLSNPDYRRALEGVDALARPLLDAIVARPGIADERWMVVVCTDHGGMGTSHGALTDENRDIPLFVAGPAVRPALPSGFVSHADVHPTVMRFLGAFPPASWRLDSRALGVAYETSCADGTDDDGDRLVDCDDRDCLAEARCGCAGDDAGSRLGRAVFTGTTVGYAHARTPTCGRGATPERRVLWTAPRAGTYTFDLTGSPRDLDLVMAALRGGCDGPEVACNDDASGPHPALRLTLAEGERVALLIEAKDGATGSFRLNVEALDACPDRDLGSATGASVASGTVGDTGGTFFASCSRSGRDVLLRWRAPADGAWRFDTAGSDYDTVLHLRDGDCDGPEIACSDDVGGGDYTSNLLATLRTGQVVTVVLSGFNGRPEGPGALPAGGTGRWVLNIYR